MAVGIRAIALGLGVITAGGVGWSSIDSDWRNALLNPTYGANVFTWSQRQRDTHFRMFDRAPLIQPFHEIAPGETVREFRTGRLLKLDIDITAFMDSQRAAALVILQGDRVRLERYGLDFSAEKRWTSFSVAKSFVSVLVGAALADGAIESLDDPVTRYVPELAGSAYEGVTIKQLLTMSSGVDWDEDYKNPDSDANQFVAHDAEDETPSIVSYVQPLERAAAPGTRFRYSTGETTLLGRIVESATGTPLAEYLSEKVWKPFGMEARATWLVGSDDAAIGGCCIQATARDYARFGLFMLEGGQAGETKVLSEAYLTAATSRHAATRIPERPHYGYQWWLPVNGGYLAQGAFGQSLFIDPERDLVIVMLGSWTSPVGDVNNEAKDRFDFFKAVQQSIDTENAT